MLWWSQLWCLWWSQLWCLRSENICLSWVFILEIRLRKIENDNYLALVWGFSYHHWVWMTWIFIKSLFGNEIALIGLVFEKRHSVSSIDEQLNASELQVILLENGESISHNIVVIKHRARLGIYKKRVNALDTLSSCSRFQYRIGCGLLYCVLALQLDWWILD